MEDSSVNHDMIKRIVAGWPKRAGVRNSDTPVYSSDYDPKIPDYPIEILPFADYMNDIDQLKQQQILTWAWIFYNQRVVLAEERVANPAFAMIINGKFPGVNCQYMRQALQQCLIDEHYHTLLHMVAVDETIKLRDISGEQPQAPHSVIYRHLLKELDRATESWEKDLLFLVWTLVSEVSINAYLGLLSTNNQIQPMHKQVTWLHNRDEYAHSKVLVEVIKIIFRNLNPKQKDFFIYALQKALDAFTASDFSLWESILKHVEVENYSEIIQDCQTYSSSQSISMSRDFTDLKVLVNELNIKHKFDSVLCH